MTFRGLVTVNGRRLYAEHQPPKPGFPTLILLNGLTASTPDWAAFLDPLLLEGYGAFCFDFRGQGRSLRNELEENGHFDERVACEEQSADLEALLGHFGIPAPYFFVGMSYGGGVAFHYAAKNPEKISKLILIVPYLIRLDQAFSLQRTWSVQLDLLKNLGPFWSHATDNARRLYQQFLVHYMDKRFSTQVHDQAVRKASVDLALGMMGFNAFSVIPSLPAQSVHLISVGRDSLVPKSLYAEFWEKLPKSVKESWLFIEDGEHLILDQFPVFVAHWVDLILSQDSRIAHGRKFHAQAYSFEVWDEGGGRFAFPSFPSGSNWQKKKSM